MNTTLGGLWSLGIKTRERGEGKGEAEGEGRRGSGMHVCLSVRPSVCAACLCVCVCSEFGLTFLQSSRVEARRLRLQAEAGMKNDGKRAEERAL